MYPTHTHKDRRGVDLIFHALPFGALWYIKPGDAVSYANFCRSHDAVIRIYAEFGQSDPDRHEHTGNFQRLVDF
jgi:hypothetical protein